MDSATIQSELGLDPRELWHLATGLIGKGVPVHFRCPPGVWPTDVDSGISYEYAERPEDLYELRIEVEEQIDSLEEMLAGIERAQTILHDRCGSPLSPDSVSLFVVYGFRIDLEKPLIKRFLRDGDPRSPALYHRITRCDPASRPAPEPQLDRYLDFHESTALMDFIVGGCDLDSAALVPIYSWEDAKFHLAHPVLKGHVGLDIDLPPEIGRCWFNGIDPAEVSIWQLKSPVAWQERMESVFRELRRVLAPGAHVAFEVGEVRGGRVLLESLVVPAAMAAGLTPLMVLINDQAFTKTSN